MNDRQLLSFIKIAETGSFSKAARDSFISVPAIVQQMDRLEETLGFRLFSRNNQGAELTTDGKIFYEAALEMQRTYEEAVLKIKSQREITIGVAPNQCPEFLLDACAAFQETHPQQLIHFVELPYEQHLEMLRQGKMDLTVIAKPKTSFLKDLEYQELCEDTCAFGVNERNPLTGKEKITLEDLRGVMVLCGTYHYMEQSFEELLGDAGAGLCPLHTEYDLESRARAKFSDSLLVFHSLWKNCYSHMFRIVSSEISAGSVGVVCRKGEKERLKGLVEELKKSDIIQKLPIRAG